MIDLKKLRSPTLRDLSFWFHSVYTSITIEKGYHHADHNSFWYSGDKEFNLEYHLLTHLGEYIELHRSQDAESITYLVLELENAIVAITSNSNGSIHSTVTATDWEIAHKINERLGSDLPKPEALPETSVYMTLWLWNEGSKLPVNIEEEYKVPAWKEIRQNYPSAVATQIDSVMGFSSETFDNGRVMLFHGPPGTGKTHIIRAIAREWNDWANCHYIVDAENFFGNPYYLLSVLMKMGKNADNHSVLIIEDCGQFITPQAKGQTLGRLLNTADGILGQNLNLSIVMTTNEPLTDVHPALARPGRCAALIEFPSFDEVEANEWLTTRGVEKTVDTPVSLAELYATSRDSST